MIRNVFMIAAISGFAGNVPLQGAAQVQEGLSEQQIEHRLRGANNLIKNMFAMAPFQDDNRWRKAFENLLDALGTKAYTPQGRRRYLDCEQLLGELLLMVKSADITHRIELSGGIPLISWDLYFSSWLTENFTQLALYHAQLPGDFTFDEYLQDNYQEIMRAFIKNNQEQQILTILD